MGAGGWLAGGSLMGWERPGPDSILPRAAPPAAVQLLLFLSPCAQALRKPKVFDLTRGDGRRWSLRQTGDPAPWPPSTSTSTSVEPSRLRAHPSSLVQPLPSLAGWSSSAISTTRPPVCSSDICPQPHAHASRISRRSHMLIVIHSPARPLTDSSAPACALYWGYLGTWALHVCATRSSPPPNLPPEPSCVRVGVFVHIPSPNNNASSPVLAQ